MIGTLHSGAQTAQIGTQVAAAASKSLLPVMTHAAWAVPVVGAAIAGVGLALTLIFARKGPKQKEEASRIADDAAKQLQANLDAYMDGPRTRSNQAAALANVDYAFEQLRAMWPALGEPGQRAIKERLDPTSCKWRDAQEKCWNWVIGYRDPIANDPLVQDDVAAAIDDAALSGMPLLAWAGAGLLLVGVML